MAESSSGLLSWSAWHNRLAKAETLLALALLMEWIVMPHIKTVWRIPPWEETLMKMALVVGLFGPVFAFVRTIIDKGLDVTRKASRELLLASELLAHALIIGALFVGFFRSMHKAWPWN